MPELPEIEALRRYLLREGLVGRTFVEVDAEWPGVEDTIDGMGGLSPLVGRRIKAFGRHGKQLIAKLDTGVLGLHMGMTGRLDRIELLNPSERIIDLLDNLGVLDLLTVGQGTNPFDAELAEADPISADKRSLTEASLEAHKLLMKINPENVPRFKDVAKFLEEDLERQ